MSVWQQIAERIGEATGRPFSPRPPQGAGGGCISEAFRLGDGRETWFVKTNRADLLDMFEAEAAALDELASSKTIAVPQALCTGIADGHSFIVMSHLELGNADRTGWRRAGEQLAALHRCRSERFGWSRDNTIGATPQHNAWQDDWAGFWRDQRIGFQLAEAARNGHHGRLQALGEQLISRLPALLDHRPEPSLLHGDLWGGNIAFTKQGDPVIYDPATYYGDREADLAMTELFGGFDRDFHAAYRAAWPLDAGYVVRRQLYNLYHVLNHLNLFGGGYRAQAEHLMQALLAEC